MCIFASFPVARLFLVEPPLVAADGEPFLCSVPSGHPGKRRPDFEHAVPEGHLDVFVRNAFRQRQVAGEGAVPLPGLQAGPLGLLVPRPDVQDAPRHEDLDVPVRIRSGQLGPDHKCLLVDVLVDADLLDEDGDHAVGGFKGPPV